MTQLVGSSRGSLSGGEEEMQRECITTCTCVFWIMPIVVAHSTDGSTQPSSDKNNDNEKCDIAIRIIG